MWVGVGADVCRSELHVVSSDDTRDVRMSPYVMKKGLNRSCRHRASFTVSGQFATVPITDQGRDALRHGLRRQIHGSMRWGLGPRRLIYRRAYRAYQGWRTRDCPDLTGPIWFAIKFAGRSSSEEACV